MDLKFCLQLNFQCRLLHRIKFPVSIKGKEKELLPAPTPVLMSASPSIQPGSHNLNIQPSMGSSKAMSQQIASNVKKKLNVVQIADMQSVLLLIYVKGEEVVHGALVQVIASAKTLVQRLLTTFI